MKKAKGIKGWKDKRQIQKPARKKKSLPTWRLEWGNKYTKYIKKKKGSTFPKHSIKKCQSVKDSQTILNIYDWRYNNRTRLLCYFLSVPLPKVRDSIKVSDWIDKPLTSSIKQFEAAKMPSQNGFNITKQW